MICGCVNVMLVGNFQEFSNKVIVKELNRPAIDS
jgi:hypothetical protein